MKKIALILLMLISTQAVYSSQFEELDKPPEGAHRGQILLGAFTSIGYPFGEIIDAENNFLKYSTYTFLGSYTTKSIKVNHLTFNFGILFEYMPFDHIGIKIKIKRSSIPQRTVFGSDYENWSKLIYSDYSFYLGPSIHATSRKQWDFTLTPFAGYAIAKYIATPIAAGLIYNYEGSRKKSVNNIALGAEFNLIIYFSGGFFMSLGCDWSMNMLKFGKKFYLLNPQTNSCFFLNKRSSNLHSVCFILSAGYAFSN